MHREEGPPMEDGHGKGRDRRRRRKGRLSAFEKILMAVGGITIVYLIVRGLVYVAVLLAR